MIIRPQDKYMNDRVYCYVDGSNIIRSLGTYLEKNINSDHPTLVIFNTINKLIDRAFEDLLIYSDWRRSHWFGSFTGGDDDLMTYNRRLRDEGFDPFLFKKKKNGSEKQVDTQLVTKLLTDSFKGLFDLAVIVSGDLDYLNAIKEVRRNGQDVIVAGFSNNSNVDLIYEADHFMSLDSVLNGIKPDDDLKHLLEMLEDKLDK